MAVEKAMRAVPRHALLREIWSPGVSPSDPAHLSERYTVDPEDLSDDLLARIYSDLPIVTKVTDGRPSSSTSQPSLVAQMLEFLDLRPGLRVLEVGAGTGYNAALTSQIVGDEELVTTIDIAPDVAELARRLLAEAGYPRIGVLCSDGAFGHPPGAPFDRIVATVGCTDIAPAWLEQLAPGGFLLIPLEHFTLGHPLIRVSALDSGASGRVLGPAGFMRIEGTLGPARRPGRAGVRVGEDRQSPVPAEMSGLIPGWHGPGWDFLYYLSLADARSGPGMMLADEGGSVRVEFGGSELLETGDSDHLRDELLAHVAKWNELGRPEAADWMSTFVPVEESPPAAEYRIDRIHHSQIATLP